MQDHLKKVAYDTVECFLTRFDNPDLIEKAVDEVITEAKILTYDLGGKAKTSEVGDEIAKKIRSYQ